ncbi:MAG TPA: hypothetical protein VFM18_20330, partial [Methanosarcina sp.]|nr:hypothetical protein [Methanosarcina sp.]
NRAHVSQKAIQMLSIIKNSPISYTLAVAALYAACLKEGEKVSQLQIAVAGNTSFVTLRKDSKMLGMSSPSITSMLEL